MSEFIVVATHGTTLAAKATYHERSWRTDVETGLTVTVHVDVVDDQNAD